MIDQNDVYKFSDVFESMVANSEKVMVLDARINDGSTAMIATSIEVDNLKIQVNKQNKIIEFLMDEFLKKTNNVRQRGMYDEIIDDLYPIE